jgi:tight adherence protein B
VTVGRPTARPGGWQWLRSSPGISTCPARRRTLQEYLVQAGLDRIRPAELVAVEVVLFTVAAAFGYAVYGGWVTALTVGLAAALIPIASARSRRRNRLETARESWPRLIEKRPASLPD